MKLSTGKWVYIFPDSGEGYRLYDPIAEAELGRILFDTADHHWFYDDNVLSVDEQEELASAINGHQKEMEQLLKRTDCISHYFLGQYCHLFGLDFRYILYRRVSLQS